MELMNGDHSTEKCRRARQWTYWMDGKSEGMQETDDDFSGWKETLFVSLHRMAHSGVGCCGGGINKDMQSALSKENK